MNVGRVVQVIGPTVDVAFEPDQLPKIYNAILIEDPIDGETPVDVGRRLLAQLEPPFVHGGKELFVRASIGIATTRSQDHTADEVLRNADVRQLSGDAGSARAPLSPVTCTWRSSRKRWCSAKKKAGSITSSSSRLTWSWTRRCSSSECFSVNTPRRRA